MVTAHTHDEHCYVLVTLEMALLHGNTLHVILVYVITSFDDWGSVSVRQEV
jgi:hypothetical protein